MDCKYVRVEIPDTYGIMKGYYVTKEFVDKHVDKGMNIVVIGVVGATAANELINGTGIGIENGFPDAYFYPDLTTLRANALHPHKSSVFGSYRLLANDRTSSYVPFCTRGILQKAIDELYSMGFKLYGAFEYEFYLFEKDKEELAFDTPDLMVHSHQSKYEPLAEEIMECLERVGIKPECFHLELDAAQLEITYNPAFDMDIADNASRYKQIVREVCDKHGYRASFMSKPTLQTDGSSAHFNHSVWTHDGTNALFEDKNPHNLSTTGKHWLAGIQHHFDALACLAASNPNCYSRLLHSFLKPMNAWGIDNRRTSLRVKNVDSERTYFEYRVPGAGTNPYLITAAVIFAGMDGIKNKMKLLQEEPFQGHILPELLGGGKSSVPQSFSSVLESINNDKLFTEKLGSDFMRVFNALRRHEIKKYEDAKESGQHWEWQKQQYKYL